MDRRRVEQLNELSFDISLCRRCPRLVQWREQIAKDKRASFQDELYWGRPVPGFGDPNARVLLLGLAPAAHGGNRTGRIFTGDRSGDFLFASLFRTGFANQAQSRSLDDGLKLFGCYIAAAVRCAPPGNKPSPEERDNCQPWLEGEIALLTSVRVIVCLGSFAWNSALRVSSAFGEKIPSPRPKFGHGARFDAQRWTILGSYHPSQQNTFTGKLTEAMLDDVLLEAKASSSPKTN